MSHTIPIRIYYEDTDAGGVVYHASYIRFSERGRTEFLRFLNYENSQLQRDYNTMFVVRHIEVDYLKPAFLDNLLSLKTSTLEMKNTSFIMRQSFYPEGCEGDDKAMICDIRATLVSVDTKTIRPKAMPDVVKADFAKHLV